VSEYVIVQGLQVLDPVRNTREVRADFKETPIAPDLEGDLRHCEKALQVLQAPNLIERVKAKMQKAEENSDSENAKGRERN
jgi:hypothetical protein